jgi:hypothetical protein
MTSLLAEMEPILVEYCIRLARIGQALTKDQLVGLAISMIEGAGQHLEKEVFYL